MPVFKRFAENGDLLNGVDEPLTEGNLELFVKERGLENSKFYIDAMVDFNKQLVDVLYAQTEKALIPRSRKEILKNGNKLFNENTAIIKFAKKLIENDFK